MSRRIEILDLLRSVNPAPPSDDRAPEADRTQVPRMAPLVGKWEETGPPREWRIAWKPALIISVLVASLAGASTLLVQRNTVSFSELVGNYRGSLIREGGPRESDVRQLVQLEIAEVGGELTAELTHSPAGATSLDQNGNVVMPMEVLVTGLTVELHWDPLLGPYQDSTAELCRWRRWDLVMRAESDGTFLRLDQGSVEGLPPADSGVGEFLSGCPQGERQVLRLVLARQ